MHARVSFGRKSRIRPEGRCLVLRTHELGFVGERELAKVRERAQLVGGHARFTPLPGVKAVARKKEAKQLPELFRRTSRSLKSSGSRSEEHTSELQSRLHLVCRLL